MKTIDARKRDKHYEKFGDGSIRELSADRFMISFCDAQGTRRRKSFNTEAKARKALTRALALRDAGMLDPHEGRITVDALAESYKTYAKNSVPKSYDWLELVWRVHLEPVFGGYVASRVTSDHLQQYIADRLQAGAATSTINRELAVLKAIFRMGTQADPPKILRVPRFPEKLREPNPRSGFVVDEQYKTLQANCSRKDEWLHGWLAVAYNYGMRRGETLGLRVHQIDLNARTIHLLPGTTKNDKGRTVVMTNEVHKLLAECVKGKDANDAVFTRPNGEAVRDFRGAWNTLRVAAGMPDLLVHDLRRSGLRRMVRRGITKQVAKKISGHLTDSVFDRYDIVDEQDLVDAANKLEPKDADNSSEQGISVPPTRHKLGTEPGEKSLQQLSS